MTTDTLPQVMTAIEISAPGGPEVLVPTTRPVPAPAPGEVLIKVSAAGVNRPDCLQRRGVYPAPEGASDIPGVEVSGHVVACNETDLFTVGDRVCALLSGGGYAEYCTAPATQCLPIPEGLDFITAAAIPETFFTVWSNLFDRGRLTSGDQVLVHGGASGIGTTAIQLATAFGARVFATAGSAEKCALCEKLGATKAINYRDENFFDVITRESGGVDIILDIVGGRYAADNVRLLNSEGRLVIIGVLGGAKGEIDLSRVLMRRLVITGSTLRPRSEQFKAEIAASLRTQVWPKLETRDIKPVIQKTLPFGQASAAHEVLEANAAMGKILLVVDDAE